MRCAGEAGGSGRGGGSAPTREGTGGFSPRGWGRGDGGGASAGRQATGGPGKDVRQGRRRQAVPPAPHVLPPPRCHPRAQTPGLPVVPAAKAGLLTTAPRPGPAGEARFRLFGASSPP